MSFQVVTNGCKSTGDGGRVFTNYSPTCNQDLEIRRRYQLDNNNAYRMFLQRNAHLVMDHNNQVARASSNTNCSCSTGCNTFSMNQQVPGNYIEYNKN